MSDSDSSQRTGRSQLLPLTKFPRLHETDATTLSTDNATNIMPSLSHGDGRNHSTLVYKDHDPANATQHHHHGLPSLHIRTDIAGPVSMDAVKESDPFLNQSLSPGSIPRRTPSLRAMLATSAPNEGLSPASVSSPQLVAMGDITPLPSPIGGMTSWRHRRGSQSLSRTSSAMSRNGSSLSLRLSDSSQMLGPTESRSRNKPYPGLGKATAEISPETPDKGPQETTHRHTRNRSLSEYVPPGRSVPIKPRPIAVSGAGLPQGMTSSVSTDSKSTNLHREEYLAIQRGIALPTVRPPTPPRSRGNEAGDAESVILQSPSPDASEEIYSVRSIRTDQPRKYRKLRQLGQGTFSQVSLAVRMENRESSEVHDGPVMDGLAPTTQKLVAVKIIEYGPAGGADEERLEVSLKREVEILKSVNHPSLVQLKAFGSDEKRALLVLDYCPGGDLFDVAASGVKPMSPALIRRIFAELVDAVRYLHGNYIVHRDIKLENVLVTLPPTAMEKITDWRTYDRAVVTLSDLGLSRRIPEPPESPLLQTRCGSEDYAAPEILMGQPYDGRLTDAWALGVLLYAMMENRLPFDALPGARGDPEKLRARTPHRIARCEWAWYRYADSDGEWDPVKGKDLEGARECVEGLLKRNTRRKGLDEIAALDWVKDAIDVPVGLKRGDREVP
ncbi:putative protein kinase [Aspergillus fischeri NRRL 181]|uniref:Protein kinase, putative n=1 Tax=Neosartorya fischeri (strain ATCC 1020 / DSM 3700 / CBS 544.65 / FGSC A1164 / JCM 1740 / NRRL 181 / WB 181) TaxID=331117 RepID=A1DHX2_NEOFI|nr:protein kinase, putative [Aspergillus fischeri NRRL 181]EAW18979.1 protein kinase, putative [Aspergillus fischeri NRRL 181]KAG2002132.1 hypothetical protein GB937_009712 [Aspergillus fischeri]